MDSNLGIRYPIVLRIKCHIAVGIKWGVLYCLVLCFRAKYLSVLRMKSMSFGLERGRDVICMQLPDKWCFVLCVRGCWARIAAVILS